MDLTPYIFLAVLTAFVFLFAYWRSKALEIHVEGTHDFRQTLRRIRALGKKVGVVLKPNTPATSIADVLGEVDVVLVMTVEPGFGGQAFMPTMLEKVRELRHTIDRERLGIDLEVDGGIDVHSTGPVVAAGARVLVAGSSIFLAQGGVAKGMEALRVAAEG